MDRRPMREALPLASRLNFGTKATRINGYHSRLVWQNPASIDPAGGAQLILPSTEDTMLVSLGPAERRIWENLVARLKGAFHTEYMIFNPPSNGTESPACRDVNLKPGQTKTVLCPDQPSRRDQSIACTRIRNT